MSLIHVIEQLGANSALQQLNQAQLTAMFSDAETNATQLEALLKGNIDALTDLLQVPVYRCILEVPAEEEEQPAEPEGEKSANPSVRFQ
ncbi:MAG: hypothetical protein KKE30_11795 [Gammaproteobacteria bacterium]|nr:hypothetical protein [Gammaproteobacteria bacterium]MBU1439202.1 hypothetical protein [Gammaproteobacteria bacterium]